MEYVLTKEEFNICEPIFDGSCEQPVDLDFSLPDYCPDIEKILKCRVCPSITSKSLSSERLDIDGVASIKVLYLDSQKHAIRCCEHTAPFSCSFSLKGDATNAVAITSTKAEYLNCRALTPRRLDIHGAFSVTALVLSSSAQEVASKAEGDDIEQRNSEMLISSLRSLFQQQFTIGETLDIGQNRPAPQSILRSELISSVIDCKPIADKLMLKGEAVLKLVYVTDLETGELDSIEFNIPINEMIDANGADDTCTCDVSLETMSFDASLRSDFDDSSSLINFEAKLCATVSVYCDNTVQIIDDAYSRAYELDMTYKQISFKRLVSVTDESFTEKNDIELSDNGISQIIDIYSEAPTAIAVFENGKLTIKGRINYCIVACDNDNVPFYTEKQLDFTREYETPADGSPSCRVTVTPLSISYRISGEKTIELKTVLKLYAPIFESISKRAVNEIVGNEEQEREKDRTAALTIYYADEGENLWSIARSYCTSVEAIKLENDLTDDVINARGMILIPM